MVYKRGIMVDFLTTVILAMIIFLPACLLSSKFFRLSDQADENFNELVTEIKELGNLPAEQVAARRSGILILDDETALFYFEDSQFRLNIIPVPHYGLHKFEVLAERPAVCNEQRCLCLFKSSTLAVDTTLQKVVITPTNFFCREISVDLEYPQHCGFGTPVKVQSSSCEGGFMLDRNLLASAQSEGVESYYQNFRRIEYQLEKKDNAILFQER